MTDLVSEDISIDPGRGLILSPGEDRQLHPAQNLARRRGFSEFSNFIPGGGDFDSAAEDCSTGIALSTMEFTDQLFITDLTQAVFVSGFPAGTWSAPNQIQTFPDFSGFGAGTSGIAVAPGNTTWPSSRENSAPTGLALFRCHHLRLRHPRRSRLCRRRRAPIPPTGLGFSLGLDPHTLTAYTSPEQWQSLWRALPAATRIT